MAHDSSSQMVVQRLPDTATAAPGRRCELLADDRRRTTLAALATLGAPVEVDDIARAVAKREAEFDHRDRESLRQLVVSLHHRHLPKIDAAGLIDYDPDRNRVESCPLEAPSESR